MKSSSPTSPDHILCPQCGSPIPITETLGRQLTERVRKEMAVHEQDLAAREAALHAAHEAMEKRVRQQVATEKAALAEELTAKARAAVSLEMRDLTGQLKEKDERLRDAEQKELELRKRERTLEEAKHSLELEVARRLDAQRRKPRQNIHYSRVHVSRPCRMGVSPEVSMLTLSIFTGVIPPLHGPVTR